MDTPAATPYQHTVIAVAAEGRKLHSAPVQAILASLRRADPTIHVLHFDDVLMARPITSWPLVHVLLTLYSTAFPLDKVLRYIALRNPLLLNNLHMQPLMQDRRLIRQMLSRARVPIPHAVYVDRLAGDHPVQTGHMGNTLVVNNSLTNFTYSIQKPFVEKPVDPEDHSKFTKQQPPNLLFLLLCVLHISVLTSLCLSLFRRVYLLQKRWRP